MSASDVILESQDAIQEYVDQLTEGLRRQHWLKEQYKENYIRAIQWVENATKRVEELENPMNRQKIRIRVQPLQ